MNAIAKAAAEKTLKEAAQKALKEATEKLLMKTTKEAAEKAAKEAGEKIAKEIAAAAGEKVAKAAAEKAAKEAAEKGVKEGAKEAAEKAAKEGAKESAEKGTKEGAEKASKEGAEKASKEGAEKATKESAEKASKEGAEKATKEGAEKGTKEGAEKASKEATKEALTKTQKLKKGLLAAGALAAIGLVGYEADRVMTKSKESFDKRNEKQFTISKIASTATEMTITFANPDNLKIYAEEIVELMNVFPQINDKYDVIKQVDNTTITVVFKKPVYNNSDIKAGTMKLYADQKNDVNQVLKDDLNTVIDTVGGALGSALCTTISTLGLKPYVGYAVDGAYWAFFIIILMILMKVLQLISLLLGEHIAVKFVSGAIAIGILYGVHIYAKPYFVLKC